MASIGVILKFLSYTSILFSKSKPNSVTTFLLFLLMNSSNSTFG